MNNILNIIGGICTITGLFANIAEWFTNIQFNVYATVIMTVLGIIYLILRNRKTSAETKLLRAEKKKIELECKRLQDKIDQDGKD